MKGGIVMTFVQMIKIVVNQTFDFYQSVKVDEGDGEYREVGQVIADKGFIVLTLLPKKKKG